MGEAPKVTKSGRKYIPYLEGIRGYGFLSVFLVHYFAPYQMAHKGTFTYRFLTSLQTISYCAVPIFFALSGYLIGGILFDTRKREGFFRIFYTRRVVRVFPVYYLTLLAVAAFNALHGFPLGYHFWVHFLFIHNLFPDYVKQHTPVVLLHYWSLAVEEQFYLLWPLVVWLFPNRRKLIGVASFLILVTFAFRHFAPHFYTDAHQVRYFSLGRADAILMGVILSLIRDETLIDKMKKVAKWIPIPGLLLAIGWAFFKGDSWPGSFRGVEIAIPWYNLVSFAMVLCVMDDKSWLSQVCSQRWVCWVGKRSYSLYIFHFLYIRWFFDYVIPYLAKYMPHVCAFFVSNILALSLTFLLATLSFWFIEKPTQVLKQRLQYGPVREERPSRQLDKELAKTGA